MAVILISLTVVSQYFAFYWMIVSNAKHCTDLLHLYIQIYEIEI